MAAARIMHVDDDPDMREVVRLSLGLDPELSVRSCASGAEALAAVREWPPHLVLLDEVMPHMNGPATLAKLHLDRRTAAIPVVFVTARVQASEFRYFKSLGAAGVVAKPFDAVTLVKAVHKFLKPRPSGLEAVRDEFLGRAQGYANELAGCVKALAEGANCLDELVHIRQIARRLTDDGGIFGYRRIGLDALALEEALNAEQGDADIRRAIETLLTRISAAIAAGAAAPERP